MIYALNYANKRFASAQKLNTKTAYINGVDKVYEYSPEDIEQEFYCKNRHILQTPKGNGFYLWKPYFIKRTMQLLEENDWLVYLDAGLYYLHRIPEYIQEMEKNGLDSMCKGTKENTLLEAYRTKRDAFVLMGLDTKEYVWTHQRGAGAILLKNNEKNRKLVEEWLYYAQDERIITDNPNECGLDNYEGFVENRHDQSVFSLLSKKYGVSTDDNLFDDFSNRKTSKSLFCYHHTGNGSYFGIWLERLLDKYFPLGNAIIFKLKKIKV